jgi:tetratricopeptide (TPR) repeat protein
VKGLTVCGICRLAAVLVVCLSSQLSALAVDVESKADAEFKEAKALFEQKKYAQSVELLDKVLEHDRKLKQAYLLRGQGKERLKNLDGAIDDYNAYVLLAPEEVDVYLQLSKIYERSGKNNLALSYLSRAIVMRPKDGNIYFKRAAIYDKLDRHEEAGIDRDVAKKLGVTAVDSPAKKPISSAKNAAKKVVPRRHINPHNAVDK